MTPVFSDLCSCSGRTARWLRAGGHGSARCNPGCPAVHLSGGHRSAHLLHSEREGRLEKDLRNQHVPKLCKFEVGNVAEVLGIRGLKKRFLSIQTHLLDLRLLYIPPH